MRKRLYILLAAVLAVPQMARATGQIPDIIVVAGDTMPLFSNPLDSYFDEEHPRPADMYGMGSTACWRAYQAYWEIRSDSLFLTAIRLGENGDSSDFYPLAKVFGDRATPRGVFAYWVGEKIRCVRGKMLYYVHMGYASVFEYEDIYTVKAGRVVRKRVYDNSCTFLPCVYDVDHGLPAGGSLLERYASSKINYSRLRDTDKCHLAEVEVERVNARGRIVRAKVLGTSRRQERAVLRAVKKIPCYGVLYVNGKPCHKLGGELSVWVYGDADSAKNSLSCGTDVGRFYKDRLREGHDPAVNYRYLYQKYRESYEGMEEFLADTTAAAMPYKKYYNELFGGSASLRNHQFLTLGDSALKYAYEYWDWTDEHEKLYPDIVELEQRLGRPHNPKVVSEPDRPFEYLVRAEELAAFNTGDTGHLYLRCRQMSHQLRGFGENDLHGPLPQGVQEEWRLLLVRGSLVRKTSPVLVKVLYDGREARLEWRVSMEDWVNYYPNKDHFRHGIVSEGSRTLLPEEWQRLQELAAEAGMDTLVLENDFFTSPPAIYHVEHRSPTGYRVLNDYNHPYYSDSIDPRFWPYRAFCKYLIELADKELPFDVDDKKR